MNMIYKILSSSSQNSGSIFNSLGIVAKIAQEYMLFAVYMVVREIHQLYTKVFDQRLAKVSPNFFDRIPTVYSHPLLAEFTLATPKWKKGP